MEFRKPTAEAPVMEKTEKLSMGKQIKAAREALGMTQIQLYEITRISTFTISGLECDRIKNTSTHNIREIQKALGITIEL